MPDDVYYYVSTISTEKATGDKMNSLIKINNKEDAEKVRDYAGTMKTMDKGIKDLYNQYSQLDPFMKTKSEKNYDEQIKNLRDKKQTASDNINKILNKYESPDGKNRVYYKSTSSALDLHTVYDKNTIETMIKSKAIQEPGTKVLTGMK
ncbi:MAG: hypothetical protein NTX79_01770 [Candidatus Micrarchaeota archaeon]|nr:hypothetical protein [Candidatus Micrarchaeota archaeon]